MTNKPAEATLLPDNIAALTAYSSAKSEKISGNTWLNANESPYTKEACIEISALNRYPDPQPQGVIDAYSTYASVDSDQVIMTRGADEGIELLVRTYCEPAKDRISLFLPTYGMYKVTADTHNVQINSLSQDLLLNGEVKDIINAVSGSKLVFICNPNNPTGAVTSVEKIAELTKALANKAIVVVDEAYIEFSESYSCALLIKDFNNLVVLRTLSKAFALAGLRTGFMLGAKNTLAPVRKVIAPYPVSTVVAQIAANALCSDAITQMRRQVVILNKAKATLIDWLEQSPAVSKILSGEGNFVTLQLKDKALLTFATNTGLIMRPFKLYNQDNWLRISIGNEQELKSVKDWLNAISAQV
ncbi:histidinol-phosphate transaminase [Pseudoalteromonas sp. MMG012]|uniref:histidinol-phosphate transaminase n=1 Tax=Pseudoalteromonas sp. MMG012 TaxID=2822686 RepID=UPI001B3A0881|nr:histidinol-phosphate transaminase [Pseudoalteromonas sp. MMG012]MBQ4850241.1 histidinol-phosphate transaminase [Pseudoalteromonas sp. MMG012]